MHSRDIVVEMSRQSEELLSAIHSAVNDIDKQHARFFGQGVKKASVELRHALMEISRLSKELRKLAIDSRKASAGPPKPRKSAVADITADIVPTLSDLPPPAPVKRQRKPRQPKVSATLPLPISVQ